MPGATLPRALIDAARHLPLPDARGLLAQALQRSMTTVSLLQAELKQGPSHGSATPRRVLEEVTAGVRSAPEAEFRDLVKTSRVLPKPLWNPRLVDLEGRHLADPDAWWEDAGLIHETDSREWHLSPEHWQATMARHARLTAFGLLVVHNPPSRVRTRPRQLLAELEASYLAGRALGPRPGVRTLVR